MTTVSIKDVAYGAVGDGQKVTAVFSITSGTKNLSCTTNQWVSGDATGGAKYIAITGAGAAGATLLSRIITFTDAQHITINDFAGTTLTNSTQTVEWGHDDSPAFIAFKAAFQGQSGVVLNIPAGRYLFVTTTGGGLGTGVSFVNGVTDVQVVGAGNPVLSDALGVGSGYFLGGGGTYFKDDHSARLASVSAGQSTVTLLTPAQHTLFDVGDWAIVGGLDIQGYGDPFNNYFKDFVQILSKNTGAGTITFTAPLGSSYSSAWPLFNPGSFFVSDCGGPATLFALNQTWNCTHVYTGLVLDQFAAQVNASGRDITFTDCTALNLGINISSVKNWTGNNLDCSLASNEIDKIIGNVTINGGTWRSIDLQSPSPDLLTMTNVHVTNSFNGGARKTVMSGCTIDPDINVGPHSYAGADEFRADNCAFNGGFGQSGHLDETDLAGAGAYSMSGGVITRAKTAGTGAPVSWAIPGRWVYWYGTDGACGSFKVIDTSMSGSTISITTNLSGGFPTNIPATTLGVKNIGAPVFRLTNCTGSAAALAYSLAPSDRPIHSYWQQTYTTSGVKPEIAVLGKVVTIKFNVTSAFSGGGTFTFPPIGAFVHTIASGTKTLWGPSIDLTTTGLRTITNTTFNALGGDTNLALPSDATGTWLVLGQLVPTVSGTGGSLTVEFITDQGIAAASVTHTAPLRFRVHA